MDSLVFLLPIVLAPEEDVSAYISKDYAYLPADTIQLTANFAFTLFHSESIVNALAICSTQRFSSFFF